MSVVRFKPNSPPEPEVSNNDRILAALTLALKTQTADAEHQATAVGVAIIWHHKDPDGCISQSFIIDGLNTLETLGLLKLAGDDIAEYGLGASPGNLLADDPA